MLRIPLTATTLSRAARAVRSLGSVALLILVSASSVPAWAAPPRHALYHPVRTSIAALIPASRALPDDRKAELQQLAAYMNDRRAAKKPVNLLFICTHNSRRSHIAQLWASVAAAYFDLNGIAAYSGGTEVSAFNPRAVAALRRAGFLIDGGGDGANPHYQVTFAAGQVPMELFSKKYSDASNPQSDFVAVMTCAQADESCPLVEGAALRVPLHYEDPKAADGTPGEDATYDARVRQIGSEMLYLFARIRR